MGSERPDLGSKRLDLGSEDLILGRGTETGNRSPKGNIWSAIPVALLCMIANWSKRKQGCGPEGDEVLQNTGGLLFVLLSRFEA